jgi:hypothetical protein
MTIPIDVDLVRTVSFTGGERERRNLNIDLVFGRQEFILTGVIAEDTSVSLAFNYVPILSGASSSISNWSITGPTAVTISAVSVVLSTIKIDFTGTTPDLVYTITIPSGIQTNTGALVLLDYAGPFSVQFGSAAPPVLNPTVTSIVPITNGFQLVFSENITPLSSALLNSSWSVTGPTSVSVLNVSASGNTVTVNTTEVRSGGLYTVSIPGGFIGNPSGNPFQGPFTANFTGIGVSPIAVRAEIVDSNTVRIIYSETVQSADALNLANYSVDNGLVLTSISQETGASYLIATSNQNPGVLYSITVSNVKDLQGNVI